MLVGEDDHAVPVGEHVGHPGEVLLVAVLGRHLEVGGDHGGLAPRLGPAVAEVGDSGTGEEEVHRQLQLVVGHLLENKQQQAQQQYKRIFLIVHCVHHMIKLQNLQFTISCFMFLSRLKSRCETYMCAPLHQGAINES